jgi:hypothetical protein
MVNDERECPSDENSDDSNSQSKTTPQSSEARHVPGNSGQQMEESQIKIDLPIGLDANLITLFAPGADDIAQNLNKGSSSLSQDSSHDRSEDSVLTPSSDDADEGVQNLEVHDASNVRDLIL